MNVEPLRSASYSTFYRMFIDITRSYTHRELSRLIFISLPELFYTFKYRVCRSSITFGTRCHRQ